MRRPRTKPAAAPDDAGPDENKRDPVPEVVPSARYRHHRAAVAAFVDAEQIMSHIPSSDILPEMQAVLASWRAHRAGLEEQLGRVAKREGLGGPSAE